MKYLTTMIILITISLKAWAGDDDLTAQCLTIVDGIESTESCEIAVCANSNEYTAEWALEKGGSFGVHR
jgi:hypothetical protein